MILGLERFIIMLEKHRVCYFKGSTGNGKTSLAMRLGYELIEQGKMRMLTANIPNVLQSYPDEWELKAPNNTVDTVILLDEASKFLKKPSDTNKYVLALRKLNIILLAPSRGTVSREIARLSLYRHTNLNVIGLPIWIYKWELREDGERETGNLTWIRPSEIFGLYDTGAFPLDDWGIAQSILNVTEYISEGSERVWLPPGKSSAGRSSRRRNNSNQYDGDDTVSEMESLVRELTDTLEEAQGATGYIPVHTKRRGKRRR